MNTEKIDHIVDAALSLSGEIGWLNVTMPAVAERANVPLAEIYSATPNKHAILCRLSDKVNRAVLVSAKPSGQETPREKLFEVLMSRFDALAPYKAGLAAIKRDLPRDPGAAVLIALLLAPSMAWMLEAAGIPATGFDAPLKVLGLTHLYGKALRTWFADDSADGGKTMAELDRLLKKAEGWGKTLERR